jgi:hypothetical protein
MRIDRHEIESVGLVNDTDDFSGVLLLGGLFREYGVSCHDTFHGGPKSQRNYMRRMGVTNICYVKEDVFVFKDEYEYLPHIVKWRADYDATHGGAGNCTYDISRAGVRLCIEEQCLIYNISRVI